MDILDWQQVALRYKGFNDLYTFFNIIGKFLCPDTCPDSNSTFS